MAPPSHLIIHPTSPPFAAIIWLHGYGDEPESWMAEFKALREKHPPVKWVFMRAAHRPQAYAGGLAIPSWGDWREDNITRVGSKDYDNENILAASVRADLGSILDSIIRVDRVPVSRIIIGGFSMGATVAAEAALQWSSSSSASSSSSQLGGLVMLNGWLLPGARRAIGDGAANGLLKALVCHGTADEQVGYDCGEEAARLLREGGADTAFRSFAGLDHVTSGFGPCKLAAHEFIDALLRKASGSTTSSSSSSAPSFSHGTRAATKRRKRGS